MATAKADKANEVSPEHPGNDVMPSVNNNDPVQVAPAPAADPAEGQKDAANDEQLNENPQPEVAVGPDRGKKLEAAGSAQDSHKSGIRTSVNTVWCPKDGLGHPIGTQVCPACGTKLK